MTVLVTGVTGFTGGHLARHLRARGHRVRGLVRSSSVSRAGALAEAGVEIVVGDLTEPATLGAACTGVEVVYHVAATYREAGQGSGSYPAINVDGTRHLLEAACAAGGRRFVRFLLGRAPLHLDGRLHPLKG